MLLRKSLKNGHNNLYFHLYATEMSYKLFSHLTPLSCRGAANALTPTFENTSLTKQLQIYSLLGNLIKYDYNNLYLHPKPFIIIEAIKALSAPARMFVKETEVVSIFHFYSSCWKPKNNQT